MSLVASKSDRPANPVEEKRPLVKGLRYELLAGLLAIVCYLNILPNDYCDDGVPIVKRSRLVNDPGQWKAIWTTDYWHDRKYDAKDRDLLYRPLAITTYRLVRIIAGHSPLPQHVVNILLHALASALVVRLCRHLNCPASASLLSGALFAVLPIHSEVLCNIVGRADLIAACGLMGALLCDRRAVLAENAGSSLRWSVVTGLALFCAMSAKESAMAAVGIVALFDPYWFYANKRTDQRIFDVSPENSRWAPETSIARWFSLPLLARMCLFIACTSLYMALRYQALEGALHQTPAMTKTGNFLVDAPKWQWALGILQVWGMYWAKTFWPAELCIHYNINELRLATSLFEGYVILGFLLTIVLLIASVSAWRRGNRAVALVALSIGLAYAPTSNVLVLIRVSFAERIWYLPSIFVVVLLGFLFARLPRRPMISLITGIILFGMAARCWIRAAEWRDNGTLYYAAYRDHPNDIGCLHLYGQWLMGEQRNEEACQILRKTLEIDLGFTDAQRNLGTAAFLAGYLEEALEHLHNANMHVPGHQPTVEALEWIRNELSVRHADELNQLREAVARDPTDVKAEIALLTKLRQFAADDECLQRLRPGEERFGQNVEWQHEYAVTLVYLDKRDEAINRYEKGLRLDANQPNMMVELAMLLLERRGEGDLDLAWQLAQRAETLAPGAPFVLVCQAEVLLIRGKQPSDLKKVINLYQQAIRSLPLDSPERPILEQRLQVLGG